MSFLLLEKKETYYQDTTLRGTVKNSLIEEIWGEFVCMLSISGKTLYHESVLVFRTTKKTWSILRLYSHNLIILSTESQRLKKAIGFSLSLCTFLKIKSRSKLPKDLKHLVNFPLTVLQMFQGFCARSAMWLIFKSYQEPKVFKANYIRLLWFN